MTALVPDLPDPATSRAVLLGVSGYRNLPPVPAAVANVGDLTRVLTDPALLGLPPEHVVALGDDDVDGSGGAAAAVHQIRDIAQEAGDALIVYFAGHALRGEHGGANDLYLALPGTDTAPQERDFTAVQFRHVAWAVNDSRAARKIVILDACFSGLALDASVRAVRSGMAQLGDGVAMLASSPSTRPSWVVEGAQYTSFTGELLAILDSGVDGGPALLDLQTVYEELFAAFQQGRITEPQLSSRGLGTRIALVRNRRHRPGMVKMPMEVDLSLLTLALEPIAALAPEVTGPLQGDYQAVVDGLIVLRAGGDVETGVVFRVLAALARIAEVLVRSGPEQGQPADLSELVGTGAHEDLVASLRAAVGEEIRQAYDAAVRAIPELADDLDPRSVTIGFLARPDLTAELFEDLAEQLANRLREALESDLRRRLTPLLRQFLDEMSDVEFDVTAGGLTPRPSLRQACLNHLAESLRRYLDVPPLLAGSRSLRPSEDRTRHVPAVGLALFYGPAQIAFSRNLVAAATRHDLSRPEVASEQTRDLARSVAEYVEGVIRDVGRERSEYVERQRALVRESDLRDVERARGVIRRILQDAN